MNKEEIRIIAIFAIVGIISISSLSFYDFYTTKVQGASTKENRRISMEKDDITKVKCLEPKAEFEAKETAYLQNYNLLFSPTSKYDILGSTNANSKQLADATALKIDDDLATTGCEEAKQEVSNMKDTDRWTYFQSNWKRMMFNKA